MVFDTLHKNQNATMFNMLNSPKSIEKTVKMVYNTGRYLYTCHDCALFYGDDSNLRYFRQIVSADFGKKYKDLPAKVRR